MANRIATPQKSPILFPNHSLHCLVASSGSGKSHYCLSILKNIDFFYAERPKHILYVYEVYQDIFDDITGVEFIEGLPEISKLLSYDQKAFKCLVLDDQCTSVNSSKDYANFMCVHAHHYNYTVFYLKQSLFDRQGKYSRLINLQMHFYHLFENRRDTNTITNLGKQILPTESKYFLDAYRKATVKKFSPLLVDLHPLTDAKYMLRSNIFSPFPTIYERMNKQNGNIK